MVVIRLLVDNGLTLAVALINRSRPAIEESCAKAIERNVSKVALINANGREASAVPVSGARRLELARACIVAIAIGDLDSLDVPLNLCRSVLRQSDHRPI